MAVAVVVNSIIGIDPASGIDKTQSALIVEGALTLSGNYGGASTHGDTINFATATGLQITCTTAPRHVEIFQVPTSGTEPIAYMFLYGQGTDLTNGVLIVVSIATGLELVEAAAYAAALTAAGANIRFRATFPLGL